MYNPLNFKINPRFKHFEFSRDHLPTVVKDSLAEDAPLKVLEVGVEYGGYWTSTTHNLMSLLKSSTW